MSMPKRSQDQHGDVLWAKADAYYELIASETYPTKNPEWHSVPSELEIENPKRFRHVVNSLH